MCNSENALIDLVSEQLPVVRVKVEEGVVSFITFKPYRYGFSFREMQKLNAVAESVGYGLFAIYCEVIGADRKVKSFAFKTLDAMDNDENEGMNEDANEDVVGNV